MSTPKNYYDRSSDLPRAHIGSTFNNARNFTINDGSFKNETHVHVVAPTSPVVNEWFEKHIICGAEFDSSERDPPPRCYRGTRLYILNQIQETSPPTTAQKQLHRLLWVRGAAGVGKTAIMQTVAEHEHEDEGAVVTLFFPERDGHNDPRLLFPTLAYQLTYCDGAYQDYIKGLMARNPRILDRTISTQFKKLIAEPFIRLGIGKGNNKPFVFILDGLNRCGTCECRSHLQSRSSADETQREIIRLVGEFISENPSIPILWVFASRSEAHLTSAFTDIPHEEINIPMDSPEAHEDVKKYLLGEFREIQKRYPNHISSTHWPADEDFLRVKTAASGFFAYASTITRFIKDTQIADPVTQLQLVILSISQRSKGVQCGENDPFSSLDDMYITILQQIREPAMGHAQQLIALYLLLSTFERHPSLLVACNILGLKQNVAYGCLEKLCAVLDIPLAGAAIKKPLRILHTSFADFLQERAKFGLPIDLEKAKEQIHQRCIYISQEVNKPGRC